MKLIKTQVQCRGCQKCVTVECKYPSVFSKTLIPWKCAKCGSKLLAEIRKPWFTQKIEIRIKMVEHTQTLLNMINRRKQQARA